MKLRLFIIAMLAILTTDCEKKPIVGCWRMVDAKVDGVSEFCIRPLTCCFEDNGYYKSGSSLAEAEYHGYWYFNKNTDTLIINLVGESFGFYHIDELTDDKLLLTNDNHTTFLKKTEKLINYLGVYLSSIEIAAHLCHKKTKIYNP